MRFKHTLNVFLDNFKTSYKLMLFMIALFTGVIALNFAVIYPILTRIFDSAQFNSLVESIRQFFLTLMSGELDSLGELSLSIKDNFQGFLLLLNDTTANIVWGIILVVLIYVVQSFILGLGKYATITLINDKMAFQASSPFINSLIKDFGRACKYNLIYVPLSVLYDILCMALFYLIVFFLFGFIPFMVVKLFLFATAIVFSIAVKKSFVAGWLPAMVCGKMSCREALTYSISVTPKKFWGLMSDFSFYLIMIFAIIVASALFTFGVALLILLPASYIFVLSYKLVVYYDENNLKYFTGPDTIVKPKKEKQPTREEFLRGEQ